MAISNFFHDFLFPLTGFFKYLTHFQSAKKKKKKVPKIKKQKKQTKKRCKSYYKQLVKA